MKDSIHKKKGVSSMWRCSSLDSGEVKGDKLKLEVVKDKDTRHTRHFIVCITKEGSKSTASSIPLERVGKLYTAEIILEPGKYVVEILKKHPFHGNFISSYRHIKGSPFNILMQGRESDQHEIKSEDNSFRSLKASNDIDNSENLSSEKVVYKKSQNSAIACWTGFHTKLNYIYVQMLLILFALLSVPESEQQQLLTYFTAENQLHNLNVYLEIATYVAMFSISSAVMLMLLTKICAHTST